MPESRKSEGSGRSRGARRGRAQSKPSEPEPALPQEGPAGLEPAERSYVQPLPEGPSIQELEASDLAASLPWGGGKGRPETAPAPPVPIAVFAPIDRSDPIDVFSIDRAVRGPDGSLVHILRREYGFPGGRLPGDPGPALVGLDPRREVCHALSTTAAARCLLGQGGRFL